MARRSANTVDIAYARLRDRLVAFDVKPGARLNESEIATDLAMSRAPVREALNRLIADGLVSFEPGRGFFCRRLSVREITDLYEVRLDLEIGALRIAMAALSKPVLNGFVGKWRGAVTKEGGLDIGGLVAADEAFHLELAGLAGNGPRVMYLRNINDRIRFVRRINLETSDRSLEALGEHESLLNAMADHDVDRAVGILIEHLARSTDQVRVQVENALSRIYAEDVA